MPDPSHLCPRCRGRLFLEWDMTTGYEWRCICCSWSRPLAPAVPLRRTTNAGSRKRFQRSA